MESLHAVIAEHRPFVRSALARLGIAGSALDDAEQEVFLVLVRRRRDYDPAYSVRRWLWGISRNVAAAQRRRARRGTSPLLDDAVVEPPRAEDRVAVVQALAQLDDDHRSIWLARQRGCTAAEIATDRRVPLTTVQWRLREAQRRLQAAVGRAGQRCRAFVIWLPRFSAMSTGATTVAAAAALAAWLTAMPEEQGSDSMPVSHAVQSAAPRPEPRRHVGVPLQPPPALDDDVEGEVEGIVIFEEPTVESPTETEQPAFVEHARRRRSSTQRRRRHSPVPRGHVELLDPLVAPG